MSDKPIRWNVPPEAEWLMGQAKYLRNQQEVFRQSFSQDSRSVTIPLPNGAIVTMVLGPIIDFIQIETPRRRPQEDSSEKLEEMLILRLDNNPDIDTGTLPDPTNYTLLRLSDHLERTLEEIPKGTIDVTIPDNRRRIWRDNRWIYAGHTYTAQHSVEYGKWSGSGGEFPAGNGYETQDVTVRVLATKIDGSQIEIPIFLSDKEVSSDRPCHCPSDPDAKPFLAKGHYYDGPCVVGTNPGHESGFMGDSLLLYGLVYLPENPGEESLSIGWGTIIRTRENITRMAYCDQMVINDGPNVTTFYRYERHKAVDYSTIPFVFINNIAYCMSEGSLRAAVTEWHWVPGWLPNGTLFQPEPAYEYQIHYQSSEHFVQYDSGEVANRGGIYLHSPFIGMGYRVQTNARNLVGLDARSFVNGSFNNGIYANMGYVFADDLGEHDDLMGGRSRKLDIFHAKRDGSFYLNSFDIIGKETWRGQAIYFDEQHHFHSVHRISLLKGRRKNT